MIKQSGFSLLEIMVAAALLGGLALSGAKLMENQTKSMKTIEVKSEYNAVLAEIRSILAIETSCVDTFNNLPAVNTDPTPSVPGVVNWIKQKPSFTASVNRYQAAANPSDWRTAPAYGNGNVRILSFKFADVAISPTAAPDGSKVGSLNLVLRMQAGVNKTLGAEVIEKKIPMSIEVINAANNIRKCSSSGTIGLDNRYLIRAQGGDVFGPITMINEGIDDPSNITMTTGTNIVLNSNAFLRAISGSGIIAQTGSAITAQGGSSIILNSAASMVAQTGSNITMNGGSALTAESASFIYVNGGANLVARSGSAITAQGGSNVILNSGSAMSAQTGSIVYLNSGSNLISQSGSAITVQNGGDLILNTGAELHTQSGANIILNSGGNIVGQGGSAITMYDSSYIDFLSDKRFKYDIHSLKDQSSKIRKLRPVSYKWKRNNEKVYGLIAQELQEIFPELVRHNGPKDTLTVDYIQLIPLLLRGIQEVDKENIELKKTVLKLQEKQQKQNEELKLMKKFMCQSKTKPSFCTSDER